MVLIWKTSSLLYVMMDDTRHIYVIMLCKRWTSVISANFFRPECKCKKYYFFDVNIYQCWIPERLYLQWKFGKSLSFGECFSTLKGRGGWWIYLVFKPVAAKVIRQHMYNNFWNKKKDIIVLVNEYHDELPYVKTVQHFFRDSCKFFPWFQ